MRYDVGEKIVRFIPQDLGNIFSYDVSLMMPEVAEVSPFSLLFGYVAMACPTLPRKYHIYSVSLVFRDTTLCHIRVCVPSTPEVMKDWII